MGERVYRAGPGLDVVVADLCHPGVQPKAVISVRGHGRALPASPQAHPLMVRVWVSASRLQLLLGGSDAAQRTLASLQSNSVDISVENGDVVHRIRDEIEGSKHAPYSFQLFLQAKVIELLINGLDAVAPAKDSPSPLVLAAVDRLLADPLNPPTMADLASSLGISPRALSHQFKTYFGISVPEWLTERRLVRARDLVVGGSIPLTEIATSLGYAHLSNFSTAFSKRFGLPPARMRSNWLRSAERQLRWPLGDNYDGR